MSLAKADLTGVNLQGASLQRANLAGADLSMANLRGASLIQADMRDTNLLGAELRGANLMGANLYGAEGVWVGRLGGANLFDAILPETVAAFDSSKRHRRRPPRVARWFYFLMLSLSAFVVYWSRRLPTAFDLEFVRDSARLGNFLPMTGFYLGGPILLFIAYVRFHFLLLRLWGSMAELPAVFVDGQTLEKDGPWYLMGVVRRHFRWNRDGRSPFAVLETMLSTILAYWVVPATLFVFWLRYLVRQDFRGTLLHFGLADPFRRRRHLPAFDRFRISAARRIATPQNQKPSTPGISDVARRTRYRLRHPPVLARHQSRFAFGSRHRSAAFQRRHSPLGRERAPVRRLSTVRRFDGGHTLHSAGRWQLERPGCGRRRRRAPQPDQSSIHSRLSRLSRERQALARESGRRLSSPKPIFVAPIFAKPICAMPFSIAPAYRHALLVSSDIRRRESDRRRSPGRRSFLLHSGKCAPIQRQARRRVTLRGQLALRTDATRSDLTVADLRDTKLEQTVLSFANLQQADLSSAKWIQAKPERRPD